MASSATCPESEKKKLSNILSNATADMLESHYDITVPDHMKDYRVVVQDFIPQHAIISSPKVTEDSKFIFYDPNLDNKKDKAGYIKFYDREGKPIDSIKIKKIKDILDYKKLKTLKDKPYEEKAIPAEYSKDELENETGSFSKNKLLLSKKNKKTHHIKKSTSKHDKFKGDYTNPIGEFIGITLFNAALKKAGLYEFATEYTIVRDESGEFYFDSTDAREDASWKYQKYVKYIDLNMFKAISIANYLQSEDIWFFYSDLDNKFYIRNILHFIDDNKISHAKIIDLGVSTINLMNKKAKYPCNEFINSWYDGFLIYPETFNSTECRDAILEGFRAVSEVDVLGELQAIEPLLNIRNYDILEMSRQITSSLNNNFDTIKNISKYIPYLNTTVKSTWESFCQETNFYQEALELNKELQCQNDTKLSSFMAELTIAEDRDICHETKGKFA